MSKKRWFRFHIDRWRNGTFSLTPNERVVFLECLLELYDHDGFCRIDSEVLARRCNMRPSSFSKALSTLIHSGKLNVDKGFITARSVSEEIESREKLVQKSVKSREKLAEKSNEINKNGRKVSPYTEYRTKKTNFTVLEESVGASERLLRVIDSGEKWQ